MTIRLSPTAYVCPNCLRHTGRAVELSAHRACPACGREYFEIGSVPILLPDDELREQLRRGATIEARATFYQRESTYLRARPSGHDGLETALGRADAKGLVLEVGSGSGAFAGTGGDDYVALDYSLAHLTAHLDGWPRICATAEAIPLADRSCRFVFSIAVLEHVPLPDRAFLEIDRILAPGGIAYLAPAWHCRPWAAEGLPVRPYRDLTLSQSIQKALIPIRDNIWFRGISAFPQRLARRVRHGIAKQPSTLKFDRLAANYETFWMSDSDACSSIDSHEGLLFFETRNYQILDPTGPSWRYLFARGGPIVVQKPNARVDGRK